MIAARLALEGIRSELRTAVLPELRDEYARSVVVAALGILGDLALQVESDEDWCDQSVDELAAACARWGRSEAAGSVGERLAAAVELAASERSPARSRAILLEAVESLVGELWARPRDAAAEELLHEARQIVAGDLARELERIR